ncbi:hypothetical protein DL764_000698 [Monosporascus ibericus]|uniref:Uncharacterized protein n=1 Tax=Monosporascus ibericus TaxID=155417 RepID=A0A4Q4TUY9_9PEZI|nr:hypothetical protein DL764_000698 [Monosporascus ibericus]
MKAGCQIEWLTPARWHNLKYRTAKLFLLSHILPTTPNQPRVKGIGLPGSQCQAVGQAIWKMSQPPRRANTRGVSLLKSVATTHPKDDGKWKSLVSRALLFRVDPKFRHQDSRSGTAVCVMETLDDGSECAQVTGFASFYQAVSPKQYFDLEDRRVEDELVKERIAFHAAFQVPKELTEHIIL